MEKYSEEELIEITELLKNSAYDKSLVKYTKDSNLINKAVNCEEYDDEFLEEMCIKIASLVPEEKFSEFAKQIDIEYIEYLYNKNLTTKYPELFQITIKRLFESSNLDFDYEGITYLFDETDIESVAQNLNNIQDVLPKNTNIYIGVFFQKFGEEIWTKISDKNKEKLLYNYEKYMFEQSQLANDERQNDIFDMYDFFKEIIKNSSDIVVDNSAKKFLKYCTENEVFHTKKLDILESVLKTGSIDTKKDGLQVLIKNSSLIPKQENKINNEKSTKSNNPIKIEIIFELLKSIDNKTMVEVLNNNINAICSVIMQDKNRKSYQLEQIFSSLTVDSQKRAIDFIVANLNLLVPENMDFLYSTEISFVSNIFKYIDTETIKDKSDILRKVLVNNSKSSFDKHIVEELIEQIDFVNNSQELYEDMSNIDISKLVDRN